MSLLWEPGSLDLALGAQEQRAVLHQMFNPEVEVKARQISVDGRPASLMSALGPPPLTHVIWSCSGTTKLSLMVHTDDDSAANLALTEAILASVECRDADTSPQYLVLRPPGHEMQMEGVYRKWLAADGSGFVLEPGRVVVRRTPDLLDKAVRIGSGDAMLLEPVAVEPPVPDENFAAVRYALRMEGERVDALTALRYCPDLGLAFVMSWFGLGDQRLQDALRQAQGAACPVDDPSSL